MLLLLTHNTVELPHHSNIILDELVNRHVVLQQVDLDIELTAYPGLANVEELE